MAYARVPLHAVLTMTGSLAVFETDRLSLRPHRREDYADSYSMWADPQVTRHIGGKPSTGEEAWARLLRHVGHWQLLGFGYWVVRERSSGNFVGEVGFADFKRELQPRFEDLPEIGWALAPVYHGRGYATEAVRGALRWADLRWPGRDTVCMIDPHNLASQRVAEKCGYQPTERAAYKGQPTQIFRRYAPSC